MVQKSENARLRAQLVKINEQRTNMKQKIIKLEQRMGEIEQVLGTKEDESDDNESGHPPNKGIRN